MKTALRWALHDVWDGLRGQPARLALSCLAIFVGIAALTILLAVLNGLEVRSRMIVRELGINVFAVLPSPGGAPGRASALTRDRLDLLRANLPECRLAGVLQDSIFLPTLNRSVQVIATEPDLALIRGWTLLTGRFLDAGDSRARVAVVSSLLASARHWQPGQLLVLDDVPYDIVGMIDTGGGALDADLPELSRWSGQEMVFVPLDTPAFWRAAGGDDPALDAVFVKVPDQDDLDHHVRLAQDLLSARGEDPRSFTFLTPEQMLQSIRRLRNMIRFTVGSIAILCLALGGTTLMSLMVANVRDRLPEIGLRRALGATKRDVAGLFVLEAALVSMVSALGASVVTNGILWLVGSRFPAPVQLGASTLLVPLVVAVSLGILFSYWPARIASGISPAESLRND